MTWIYAVGIVLGALLLIAGFIAAVTTELGQGIFEVLWVIVILAIVVAGVHEVIT